MPSYAKKAKETSHLPLPRTFRRNKRFRLQVYLGIVFYICPAIILTWFIVESYSFVLLAIMAVFWLLAGFTLRDLLRLPSMLVVDEDTITYSGFFGVTRLRFDDIVEVTAALYGGLDFPYRQLTQLGATDRHGWMRLTVRTASHRITCANTFEEFDELADMVLARVPQSALDGSASEEFRCHRFYRNTFWFGVIFFLGILAWAVVSAITQNQTDDFYWEVLFPILLFGGFAILSLFAAIEMGARVYLEHNRVVVRHWRGGITVPREEIVRAERYQAWYDDERLFVIHAGGRLKIPEQLERYEAFLNRLNELVPVTWRGEDKVRIPLSISTRGWISPLLYLMFGSLGAIWGATLIIGATPDTQEWGDLLGAIVFTVFGVFLIGHAIFQIARRPFNLKFEHDRIELTMAWITHRCSATQGERVELKVSRERGRTRRQIKMRIAGKLYSVSEKFCPVPLVPLYQLLCKTYWPEGYREPDIVLTSNRRDGAGE